MNPLNHIRDLPGSLRQRLAFRWMLRQNQQDERRLAQEIAAHAHPDPTLPPVMVFNTTTRLVQLSLNSAYSLLAAWGLRLQGVPVVHIVCRGGMSRCVLATDRRNPAVEPPCKACINQSEALYSGAQVEWFDYQVDGDLDHQLQGLSPEEMQTFSYKDLPLGKLALPSLRWSLRRHNLVDDEPTRFLYRAVHSLSLRVARRFESALDRHQPQSVLVFNGTFFPEAAARTVALRRGIPVVSHESAFLPFSAFFTTGEATAYPLDIPDDFVLDDEQETILDAYLEKRFQGNFSMAGIRFWPEMHSLGEAFWERASRFKQVVPVFTNVVFDTSQGHANVVFPHMFAWLDEVLKIIRSHPETYFVIRAHPDEHRAGKESQETVRDWVAANRATELPNVLFVDSNEYFSSYELMQRSKFVIIYNSTIGMEASILGTPVLCGGKPRFTQPPAAFFPQTPQAFRQQAEDFLNAAKVEFPEEHRRNARRFLYYQLYRSSLPFGDFLEEDRSWRGFARFKSFNWQALLPENSPAIQVVLGGLLDGKPFLMDER
ncbi:MAG: hypothetical protein M1281_03695 [Chloroflexi bacterium]|nr:hypothetical protein [Chloroflexota bacterium]